MKICMIGTGYVGLVSGTCFAEMGNEVIGVDIDAAKISLLQRGQVPIFEPGLTEMLQRNSREGRLSFTTRLEQAVEQSKLIFIAVGTPSASSGAVDLSNLLKAARQIAQAMSVYKIVVNKSTAPVGTAERIRQEISRLTSTPFHVVSNPEFLKEGAAIEDFMKPDRVVVGCDDPEPAETMTELYAPFTRSGAPILVMDCRSAEMTKYAANAMLATRISFINEIANLCEKVGADIQKVRQGIGLDPRIGRAFLFPGVGYGGSCLPKDIEALISLARENGYTLELLPAVQRVNESQKLILIQKILEHFSPEPASASATAAAPGAGPADSSTDPASEIPGSPPRPRPAGGPGSKPLQGRTFAVWGLSFKPSTDDLREAPSLVIVERLLELGAEIRAYDPEALEPARRILGDRIAYLDSHYEALRGADALVLITEWHVFRNPDFAKMKTLLAHPVIFDGRNQYNPREMRQLGFQYFGIGRP